MKIRKKIKQEIEKLGLTVEQVNETSCYLTPNGMTKLRPCKWAKSWIRKRGKVEITESVMQEWKIKAPDVWLCPMELNQNELGPKNGWPWNGVIKWTTCDLTNIDLVLLLKAYIIKYGKPT